MEKDLFSILKERGYVKDLTHEKEIIDLVNGGPMTFYLGIDPTADSLHIGHFFALTMFRWLQDFGHSVPRCIIPYDAEATIDFDNKRITINTPIFEEKTITKKL